MVKLTSRLILVAQLLIIFSLLFNIFKKIIIPQLSVTPIKKDSIQTILAGELTQFYEPKPNLTQTSTDLLEKPITYSTNSDTLRERFDYSARKEEKTFRIITLGDSFTYGIFVDSALIWPELLEDELNSKYTCEKIIKYEVINLGVEGYDLAYETERYIRNGKKYNPDIVIMLITDFGRVREYISQKRDGLHLSQEEIDTYKKQGEYYPWGAILKNQIPFLDRMAYQKKYFNKLLSVYSGPLLLVDIEHNSSLLPYVTELSRMRANITLEQTAMSRTDADLYFIDGHPNEKGHMQIMQEMIGFLVKNKSLPCQAGK